MSLTNFPNGVSSFGVPMVGSGGFLTQGKNFFVKPYTGSDGNSGLDPSNALKTLTKAQSLATANQNDVVYLFAESNTASTTTDYQPTSLLWAKDMVHLIGVSAGGPYNKRARIAWLSSTAVASALNPLFSLTGNGCLISNVSFAVGVANAYATGVSVTSDHNRFVNVDIAFPTHDTVDAAGGYALTIDGCDESSFEDCTFGSFTTDIGSAANQLLLVDSGCSMVKFINCDFIERLQSATNSPFVRLADAGSVGFGCLWFEKCNFIKTSIGAAYAQNGAFKTTAAQTDGRIVLDHCVTNAAKWDVDDADMTLNGNTALPLADTAGVTLAV